MENSVNNRSEEILKNASGIANAIQLDNPSIPSVNRSSLSLEESNLTDKNSHADQLSLSSLLTSDQQSPHHYSGKHLIINLRCWPVPSYFHLFFFSYV